MMTSISEKLRSAGDWLRSKFMSGAIILVYHRVADLSLDPQRLRVSPQNFAEHLEILTKYCDPMSLCQLNGVLSDGQLPHNPVALTFDDGYADNLAQAKPLLERYSIPATVFVTAGQVGSGREFWWDELERIFLQSSVLPKTLCLEIDGTRVDWDLRGTEIYDNSAYEDWSVELAENPTSRHAIYRSVCQLLRPLSEVRRGEIMEKLQAWSGAEREGRKSHLPLTRAELMKLDAGEIIDVGAHTVTHAHLSSLSMTAQQREILASKTALEEVLGHPIKTFAYPFGSRVDFNSESLALVREAGFEMACANFPGKVWRQSDRFQLPRLLVRNWDGETFERWLRGWLCG
jgi:peptidoglycan/xylan/chitin deacetylase (PgdA/CDA1 family)